MAAIICDIDDTLLRNGVQPIKKTIDWLNERAKNYIIIIVTGRPASQRQRTVAALRRAGVRYNRLIMNPGSTSSSPKYKGETAKRIKSQTRVVLAVDNDASARAAYQKAGVKAVHPSALTESMLKMTIFFGGKNAI